MQKIFTFSQNASRMSGNVDRNSDQSKNVALTSSQPGELTIAKPIAVKTTTVLTREMTTPRRPSPRFRNRRYFRTGAPTTLDSQVDWIRFSVPLLLSFASAEFTQPTSA